MTNKRTLAEQIQSLQAEAAAICRACTRRETNECRGPRCNDIVGIINKIDPLVAEYFRIELAEKRNNRRRVAFNRMWQQMLPLGPVVKAGYEEAAAAAEHPLGPPDQKPSTYDDADAGDDEADCVREAFPPGALGYGLLQCYLQWQDSGDHTPPVSGAVSARPVLGREPMGYARVNGAKTRSGRCTRRLMRRQKALRLRVIPRRRLA